jgi:uncharacterized protein (TIGR03086 family)
MRAMSEIAERYAVVAGRFTDRVAGMSPHLWEASSPCAGWKARDVVAHVVDTHNRVLASLDQSDPAAAGPDDDLPQLWVTATDSLNAALCDQATAQKTVGGMFGEQSFEMLVGRLLCADTLLHSWDLARATGQDEVLDPDAVAKTLEFLTPIDDALRRPGGFAAKIEPAAGADAQTRLLNFSGRAT